MEARAISSVFGSHALEGHLAFSSTKVGAGGRWLSVREGEEGVGLD